jgi:hypothetical protein
MVFHSFSPPIRLLSTKLNFQPGIVPTRQAARGMPSTLRLRQTISRPETASESLVAQSIECIPKAS